MIAGPQRSQAQPRPIVLYGCEELARLAWYCLTHDARREVAGFTVLRAGMPVAAEPAASLLGLPLVPFEALEDRFPPERYDLLIAIGPHQVNAPRAARSAAGPAKGTCVSRYVARAAPPCPARDTGPGC